MSMKILAEDPTKYKRYPRLIELEVVCEVCKKSLGVHQIHFSRIAGVPKKQDWPEKVFTQSGCLQYNNLMWVCVDCRSKWRGQFKKPKL